jgi:hypothetical protein
VEKKRGVMNRNERKKDKAMEIFRENGKKSER